jgi:hypothetical protein
VSSSARFRSTSARACCGTAGNLFATVGHATVEAALGAAPGAAPAATAAPTPSADATPTASAAARCRREVCLRGREERERNRLDMC